MTIRRVTWFFTLTESAPEQRRLSGGYAPTSNTIYIGARAVGQFVNGNIDDVRIYNRALSAAEIAKVAAGSEPQTAVGTFTLGGALTVNGDLTLNTGNLTTSGNNITAAGNWYNNGGIYSSGGNTVTMTGSSGADNILSGEQSFNNLSINGGATFVMNDSMTVVGTLTLTAGTFDSSSSTYNITAQSWTDAGAGVFTKQNSTVTFSGGGTINANDAFQNIVLQGSANTISNTLTVSGNWTNNMTGAVSATGSTVMFNGSGIQTLAGSTTFYGMRALTSGATLQFIVGTTNYVTNMVDLENVGLLSSGASGTTWYFSYTGSSQTLTNLSVRDSNASPNGGKTMVAVGGSTNLGNNTNWTFNIGTDSGVRYWISSTGGNWNNANNWALISGGIPAGGVPLSTHTVIFDGNGVGASTINVNVSIATMTITSGYSGVITALSTTTLTLSNSWTQAGGTVNLQGSSATISGNWSYTGGTFNAGTSTVAFNGTQTLTGSTTFYDLFFWGNKVHTINSQSTMTATNLLTFGNGGNADVLVGGWLDARGDILAAVGFNTIGGVMTTLLLIDGAGTQALSGAFSGTNGSIPPTTINKSGGALNLSGNINEWYTWTNNNLGGAFNAGTSTVSFNGALTLTGSSTFYNLQFTSGGTTAIASGSTMTATGLLTLTKSGSINTGAVVAQGDMIIGSNTGGTTLLQFTGSNTQNYINASSFTVPSGNWTVNKTGGSVKLDNYLGLTSGQSMTIVSGTLDLNGSSITVAGGGSFTVKSGGNLQLQGGEAPLTTPTLLSGSSVTYTGGATYTVQPWIYQSIVINGTGTFNQSGTTTYYENFAVLNGTYSTRSFNLTVSTNFTQSSGLVQLGTSVVSSNGNLIRTGGTFDAGSSTIQFTGAGAQTLTAAATNFYNVVINKGGGTLTLTDDLKVSGNWTNTTGIFSGVGSTVTFTGTGIQQLSGATTFYALRDITSGATLQFAVGTTNYATSIVEFRNIGLQSTGASGTTWYFSYTGSSQTLTNLRVRDSNASPNGGLAMNAYDGTSTNLGNNKNWNFSPPDSGVRYWISNTGGNWNTAANWSTISGGIPAGGVPLSTHTVIFDGNGIGASTINVNVSIATMTITSGYSGTITALSTTTLTLNYDYIQNGGTVNLQGSQVVVDENLGVCWRHICGGNNGVRLR